MYAVITTFPNNCYDVYAKEMLKSFTKYWPEEIPLLIELDDELLAHQVGQLVRPQDAISCAWNEDHAAFVQRNSDKDGDDYRHQVTRFSHKVFALHKALTAIRKQKSQGDAPRYLIWMDADVITTREVTIDDIKEVLPKDAAVSYMGRKDWPHSECGFLVFDLDNEGDAYIDVWHALYISDQILKLKETHDSWAFDHIRNSVGAPKAYNLTEGKPGMDIWQHSPMAKWSKHYKGPVAKSNMPKQLKPQNGSNFVIQTRNAIPDEQIKEHISENQKLIKNWVMPCTKTNEQIVVVSAGPQLWAEDVLGDYNAGKKIVAVKHALRPLEAAGIIPWACILLDPRPHVYEFIDNPDTRVLWFVASQVNPRVTAKLMASGCEVWGYHASVGAGEESLTKEQPHSIIGGGSATATRGLFLLKHLGFHRMKLYGYDLCYPDKVDLSAKDRDGQPEFLEMSVGWNNPLANTKKCFWTKPELIAQFEELNQIIQAETFELEAIGDGIIPYVLKQKRGGELRQARLKAKIKPLPYGKMLKCRKNKTRPFKTPRNILSKILRRTNKTTR